MGYCIEYENGMARRHKTGTGGRYLWALAAVVILLIGVLSGFFWPERAGAFRNFWIPGDPEVTVRAAETMVDSLRAGGDAQEAVTAFCREILENGEVPD